MIINNSTDTITNDPIGATWTLTMNVSDSDSRYNPSNTY